MASKEIVKKNVSGTESSDEQESSNLLPHLESLERMMKLPVVGAAWQQGQGVYGKVKDYSPMFNWAFKTAEDAVSMAVQISAPIVQKFDGPISYVDQTLVKGIDKLEVSAPIIKEQPMEIINQAKSRVLEVVQPKINRVVEIKSAGQQRAASLKELSYKKANEVLASQYGSMCVKELDNTAVLAERLLDYYFPSCEVEDEDSDNQPISATEDPVLHTVQTIGALSNKIARRVYRTVSKQVKVLKKEDVHDYVASLIAVLRLTQYLNFINDKVQKQQQDADVASGSRTTLQDGQEMLQIPPANQNTDVCPSNVLNNQIKEEVAVKNLRENHNQEDTLKLNVKEKKQKSKKHKNTHQHQDMSKIIPRMKKSCMSEQKGSRVFVRCKNCHKPRVGTVIFKKKSMENISRQSKLI